MARFSGSIESQAAQPAGAPAGTTYNGYFAAMVAGATWNYKLRRAFIGVRNGTSGGVPTSQQMTVAVYRQTIRAVGTGLSNVVLLNNDPRSGADVTGGIDVTTAAAAGTTGPTIGATPLRKFSFNTQTGWDIPAEFLEEWICDQGLANGLAFVNIGAALPSGHLFTLDLEVEV